MSLRKIMRGLLFSFTQVGLCTAGALAQNTFFEPGCFDDPANPTMCIDNGCMATGGQCYPLPAVAPDGQLTQGCVCVPDFPTPQPRACLRVIDHASGQMVCMDMNCPPTHDSYDCDPVACTCRAPRVFWDLQGRCVQSLIDPSQCQDYGCSAQGGICRQVEAQGTNGQELGGCECIFPAQPAEICTIFMNAIGQLGCYDVGCGSGIDYECNPTIACDCMCVGIIPTADLVLKWLTKTEIRFTGIGTRCSLVYNLYRFTGPRLPDADRNGVADYYGSCLLNAMVATTANDTMVPPPGLANFYLVTAESQTGEGSMGTARNGLPRPNLTPCPTPPPPFP